MKTLSKNLGPFIKAKRLEHNKRYSQGEIASILGVSDQYFSNVERGLQPMSIKYLIRLCEVLGVDFKEFHDLLLKDMSEAILTRAREEGFHGDIY